MSDRNNLQGWQAASSDLGDRKPDELFHAEFAEYYERLHNDLWQRIVRLHGTTVGHWLVKPNGLTDPPAIGLLASSRSS